MMYDYISIGLLMILVYVLIYPIINRICTCIEECALCKAYVKFGKTIQKKNGLTKAEEPKET